MIRLLYVSTATAKFQPAMLASLVETSSTRNAALQITGALAFNGKIFAQVLEGNASDIDQLMAEIERDPRHSGIIIISRRDVSERSFPDWSLKHIRAMNFDELVDSMAV